MSAIQQKHEQQVIDIRSWLTLIQDLCTAGGPKPNQYETVHDLFNQVNVHRKTGKLSHNDLNQLRHAFGPAMSVETMQGRSYLKKYGYAGDFEIIDEIYLKTVNPNLRFKAWDEFYQTQGAAKAVRNRKTYFKNTVHDLLMMHAALGAEPSHSSPIKILNVASGPCRDVAEFFEEHPHAQVHFTCVEAEANAIAYAQNICAHWLDRITFLHENAFKLQLDEQFELVWSAGLFDYFDDRAFALLLNKLIKFTKPTDGQIIVGNFSDANPSIAYQEIGGEWMLNHRSSHKLKTIALKCGYALGNIDVESEEEGINLFLRIRRS